MKTSGFLLVDDVLIISSAIKEKTSSEKRRGETTQIS